MTAIFPGSALITCEAVLQNARFIPGGEDSMAIYDCAIPVLFSGLQGKFLLCSLCNNVDTIPRTWQGRGVYNIEARVRVQR